MDLVLMAVSFVTLLLLVLYGYWRDRRVIRRYRRR